MAPKHTALALLVVVLWGLNFVVIDAGLSDVPPMLLLALRFLLVALPAVFFVPRPKAPLRTVLGIGVFMSLGQFSLLYFALEFGMPAGLASLVLQAQIILTVVVAALVLRERPTRQQGIGILVGVVGLAIVVVSHGTTAPWVPLLLTIAAALSWAIGNVIGRSAKGVSGLSLVVWSALIVPVPALLFAIMLDGAPAIWASVTSLSLTAILSTVYTAVCASLLGYGIWNSLLSRYESAKVVPFALLVPVIGILAAWVFQSEVPLLGELIGGAIMVIGLAVSTVKRPSLLKRPVVPLV
ncbi:EamA family transporter [Humidisolicoccus flavus]|uniref:EamA family transporter n=1 Tax=Humidisolicoccus flavus TaxID=3111414 RepID=UPI003249E07B